MTEWNNLKYRLMEEIGENMDIVIFRHHHTDGTLEPHIRSHADMDGTGAFCDVVEKADNVTFTRQPERKPVKVPNAFQRLILGLRFWKHTQGAYLTWKPTCDFNITGPSDAFCFYTFTPEETAAIEEHCKSPTQSITTVALKSLDKAASKHFLTGPCVRPWVIPANMRGAVTNQYELGNYSTSILIHVTDEDSAETIYDQMKDFLLRGLLWGSWFFTNLPKYMSEKFYRKMVHGMGNAAFGSLSNMGKGPTEFMSFPEGAPDPKDYIWSGCPPSSKVVPMNATIFIWAGRLVMTLKLHPSLGYNGEQASGLLGDWIEELIAEVKSISQDASRRHTVELDAVYKKTPLKYPKSE